MKQKEIITSLLDTDAYIMTMLLFIWTHYRDIQTRFALKNRSQVRYPLADLVDESELRWQLDAVYRLKFTPNERLFISDTFGYLHPGFNSINFQFFLADFQLSPYTLRREGNAYVVETEGDWPHTMYWETLILSICAELAARTLAKAAYINGMLGATFENDRRLIAKAEMLSEYPELKFMEFATRRRASKQIQRQNVAYLASRLSKQLLGTSNMSLAKEFGLKSLGTMAHQLLMVPTAIAARSCIPIMVRSAQMLVFDLWFAFYGKPLSTALNETYGSDVFWQDFGSFRAQLWDGTRPDSGDPIAEGEKAIRHYEEWGIDPREKKVVFADGQDANSMIKIHLHFLGRIQTVFGPGTNFSNDAGLPTLSLVAKPIAARLPEWDQWMHTVKLSNNLAKAQGRPEDVVWYKQIHGYGSDFFEECKY